MVFFPFIRSRLWHRPSAAVFRLGKKSKNANGHAPTQPVAKPPWLYLWSHFECAYACFVLWQHHLYPVADSDHFYFLQPREDFPYRANFKQSSSGLVDLLGSLARWRSIKIDTKLLSCYTTCILKYRKITPLGLLKTYLLLTSFLIILFLYSLFSK